MKLLENTARYRKTKKGILTNIYCHQKSRMKVGYTLLELHSMFLTDWKFDRLYNEWVASGYQKQLKPSIDRINNKFHYKLSNIQVLTWAENRFKQSTERRSRKGPIIQMLAGKPFKHYISQREAVKKTGLNQSGISLCLNGKRKYCGGYGWQYENQELL